MAASDTARGKLTCKECGHENEPERVYCHNCGVKLDRALLPTVAKLQPSERRRRETIAKVRRVQHGGAGQAFLGPLVKVLLFSFVLAVLIQSFRVPDGLPPVLDGSVESPFIQFDMDDALRAPGPRRLVYTEAQVNAYLKTTLKAKGPKGAADSFIQFRRSIVKLAKADGGKVEYGIEHEVMGVPFFVSQSFVVGVKDGKVDADLVSGSCGRLRLPAWLARSYNGVFAKFWRALDREMKLFRQMRSITIGDGVVEIISQPAVAMSGGA